MLQQHTVDKLVDLLVQHPIRNILQRVHFKAAACEAVRLGADREALQPWHETIVSWLRVVVARWREVEYANPRDKDRKREREIDQGASCYSMELTVST